MSEAMTSATAGGLLSWRWRWLVHVGLVAAALGAIVLIDGHVMARAVHPRPAATEPRP